MIKLNFLYFLKCSRSFGDNSTQFFAVEATCSHSRKNFWIFATNALLGTSCIILSATITFFCIWKSQRVLQNTQGSRSWPVLFTLTYVFLIHTLSSSADKSCSDSCFPQFSSAYWPQTTVQLLYIYVYIYIYIYIYIWTRNQCVYVLHNNSKTKNTTFIWRIFVFF